MQCAHQRATVHVWQRRSQDRLRVNYSLACLPDVHLAVVGAADNALSVLAEGRLDLHVFVDQPFKLADLAVVIHVV